jgi:hypothetical protein
MGNSLYSSIEYFVSVFFITVWFSFQGRNIDNELLLAHSVWSLSCSSYIGSYTSMNTKSVVAKLCEVARFMLNKITRNIISSSLILRNTEILIFQDIIRLTSEINVTRFLALTEGACTALPCDVSFRQSRLKIDSEGLWQWYMTLGITRILDFIRRKLICFRPQVRSGTRLLCWVR